MKKPWQERRYKIRVNDSRARQLRRSGICATVQYTVTIPPELAAELPLDALYRWERDGENLVMLRDPDAEPMTHGPDYTPEEDALVMNYELTVGYIAERIGRSPNSISNRRWALNKVRSG